MSELKLNRSQIIALSFLLFLLLAIFLLIAYLIKRSQIIRTKAAGGPASLSLSPASGTYNLGEAFDVYILLDGGGRPVAAADVSLNFDSSKLQAQSVTLGSLFDDPNTPTDEQVTLKNEVTGNTIFLSLGSLDPQTGATYFAGSGVYGIINFLAQGIGEAAVSFNSTPHTKVSESGVGDILGTTTNASYIIIETVSPTPTPTHCLPLGDIDCSGKVNALDLSSLLSVFGTNDPKADLDDSGKVNALDLSILLGNFGKSE